MSAVRTVQAVRTATRLQGGAVLAPAAPAVALGALAVAALAIGAMAIGFLAIRYLFIRKVEVGKAHFRSLEVDDLLVKRLRQSGEF